MTRWIFGGIAGFGLALAAGWATAGKDAASASEKEPRTAKWREREPGSRPDGAASRALISRLRAINHPDELAKAAISLAGAMSHEDLADWVLRDRFRPREGMAAELFRQIALERCLRECPERLLEQVGQGKADLNTAIRSRALATMARHDPERVLAWMEGRPTANWESAALQILAPLYPGQVMERLSQHTIAKGAYGGWSNNESRALLEIARHDPAILSRASRDFPGHLRLRAQGMLAVADMEKDPDAALAKLLARPDGAEVMAKAAESLRDAHPAGLDDPEGLDLAAVLLPRLGDLPSGWRERIGGRHFINERNAHAWLAADFEGAGFSAGQASKVRQSALLAMAGRGDEEAALAIWQKLPALNEGDLQQFLPYAFEGKDPETIEALLAGIANETLREQARGFIGKVDAAGSPPPREPITVDEWLADPKRNVGRVMSRWADAELVTEARERFHSLDGTQQKEVAESLIGTSMHRSPAQTELYGDALRVLAEFPVKPDANRPGHDVTSKASAHAVELMMRDAAAGSVWVDSLPAGEVRDTARDALYERWKHFDPEAAERWREAGD